MYLIVGLGNPGSQYSSNWHNCGFMMLDGLAQTYKININKSKFKGEYGNGTIGNHKVTLLKPQTYMNLSGESVREAAAFFKIPPSNIIIVYDDIDLPLGTIRFKMQGGSGTHNGMKSIISQLGTQTFPRLRIGCGPVPPQWDLADFVLSDVPVASQGMLKEAFLQGLLEIEKFINQNK